MHAQFENKGYVVICCLGKQKPFCVWARSAVFNNLVHLAITKNSSWESKTNSCECHVFVNNIMCIISNKDTDKTGRWG